YSEQHRISAVTDKKVVGRPWPPGRSGNPGGRPRAALDVQALAREHTPDAIRALVAALDSPKERVAAAVALLDRGWGRPVATHEISGDVVSYVIRAPAPCATTEEWLKLHVPPDITAQPGVVIDAQAEPAPPHAPATAAAELPDEPSTAWLLQHSPRHGRDYR